MKIAFYDPYLDTLGGGEKYILTAAKCFEREYKTYIFWDPSKEDEIKEKVKQRFGLDLSKISFIFNIFDKNVSFLKRLMSGRNYDVIFYLSDGSFPLLLGKKNILLFQFPVNWVKGRNLLTKIKLLKIDKVICYSDFVKNYLDTTFNIKSYVLPPSAKLDKVENLDKKENIILTVGRFTKNMNTKKQEVLIDAFKKLSKENKINWKLILAGAVFERDMDFVEELKMQAKGFPIEILINCSHEEIKKNYQKAKIYWHAAGYGEDLLKHPERAEHFGITTVEAMSVGAVPVVINAGGQTEIVENGKEGFLWNTKDELIAQTLKLINDSNLLKKFSENAIKKSSNFSEEIFRRELLKLIK